MSIITEALKKVAKERDKVKRRPDRITTSNKEASYKSKADRPWLEPKISPPEFRSLKSLNARYTRNKTLIGSGILLLLAIIFLTITNTFLLPSVDIEEKAPVGTSDDFTEMPVEAEAYSDVKSEIALIEEKNSLIDKMAKAFKIESTQEEFISNFILNGIVYDTEDPWAIINNRVVRIGDTLDGAEVISIAPRKVILLFKNERYDLAVK